MIPVSARFLGRRALQLVIVVLGITITNFFLLRLAPGDAAQVLAGEAGSATPEISGRAREQFGLDQPLPVQFALYLRNLLSLNLGFSFRQGLPVLELITQRLPATLLLMGTSITFALLVGSAMGVPPRAARAGRPIP